MRHPAQFKAAIRQGRRAGNRLVVLYATPSSSATWMAGLVVSKAVGNSVVRHRVSRRLRAILAGRLPKTAPNATVVVRALPGTASCTYKQLDDAVAKALLTVTV